MFRSLAFVALSLVIAPVALAQDGTLEITGLTANGGRAWIGGSELGYDGQRGALVAYRLQPGRYDLVVEDQGRLVYRGPIDIWANYTRRCGPAYNGFECHDVQNGPVQQNGVHVQSSHSGGHVEVSGNVQQRVVHVESEPPKPTAMADGDFQSLKSSVCGATYGSDAVSIVKTASKHSSFKVDQVGAIVDCFTYGADAVQAVELMAPKVVDPQNAHRLSSHFTYSSDAEKALSYF